MAPLSFLAVLAISSSILNGTLRTAVRHTGSRADSLGDSLRGFAFGDSRSDLIRGEQLPPQKTQFHRIAKRIQQDV